MKHILYIAVCFLLCVLPRSAFAETIDSFVSDITLNQDGSFLVAETILYDFGTAERHGIFRDIEKRHPQEASSFLKNRTIDIDVLEVTQDGQTALYDVTEKSDNVSIKIGDPRATIRNKHTYTITYAVKGGLSYFEDGSAEIYWNATGHAWQVPVNIVTVTLRGTPAFFTEHSTCYRGLYGENTTCEIVRKDDGSVTFSAANLGSNEGVTIAQELNGTQLEIVVLEKLKWALFGLLILPVLLIGAVYAGYRYRTAYKTGRSIIAQYEPYENFKPMYAGMLFDGRLDPRDITAGIVYLAEQGYIKIRKIERKVLFLFEVDDYEITLLRSVADIESDFLRDVALLMFELHDAAGKIVSLDELRQKRIKQAENAMLLNQLRRNLKNDMKRNGFVQTNPVVMWVLLVFGVIFLLLIGFVVVIPAEFILGFIGLLVILLVYAFIINERRTRKGYEAFDHLKGFKLFLSVTDAERLKFHNAPQKSPEQFMEYLPYAIAFGVEKQWAEAFKDLTIPEPSWYDSGSAGHFSAVSLTNSIGAFSTSVAASSVSSASRSGGSSGGGFSGGGGGGGGGGSW